MAYRVRFGMHLWRVAGERGVRTDKLTKVVFFDNRGTIHYVGIVASSDVVGVQWIDELVVLRVTNQLRPRVGWARARRNRTLY
jgi:hypothetical protein